MANTPTTTDVVISVTEPTTKTDGSALNDLTKTQVEYVTATSAGSTTDWTEIPASKPTGGGVVSKLVAVPIGTGQQGTVTAKAKSFNAIGNVGPASNTATKAIDRRAETLAPAAPTNLSIA